MTYILRYVDRPGGTVLLDLTTATAFQVGEGGLDASPPPVNRSVSQNPVRDGGSVSAAPYGLRTIKLPLVYTPGLVAAATADTNRKASLTALMRVLQRPRVWLEVQTPNATESRFLYCYRADAGVLAAVRGLGSTWAEVMVEQLADPFAYGPKESLGTLTTSVAGDLKTTITGSTIKGDVPAPLIISASTTDTNVRTLWAATKPGGGAHKCLVDLNQAGGTLPGSSTRTTTATANSVGGDVVRWANVAVGNEYRVNEGALFTTPGGGNDAKLAGSYRVLMVIRIGAAQNSGETWEFSLRSMLPSSWTWTTGEVLIGRKVVQTTDASANQDLLVDLGVVEFPFGGRPLAAGFDAPVAVSPATLRTYVKYTAGAAAADIDIDALIFLPADSSLMTMSYAAPTATARTFTADPHSGQVVVTQSSAVVPDAARVSFTGQTPVVVPGTDVDLYAFNASGGLGQNSSATTNIMPVSIDCSYWPCYLDAV